MTSKYNDIINLPRYKSDKRFPMSINERAAQFAPFRALNGFEDSIYEAGKLTFNKESLSKFQKENINRKLMYIIKNIDKKPLVWVRFFKNTCNKEEGQYLEYKKRLIKYLEYERILCFEEDIKISIDDIFDIDSDILNEMEDF